MKKKKDDLIVSKKFMVVIACVLTLLGICYGFIYFNYLSNSSNDYKRDITKKNKCDGMLEILVDYENKIFDSISIDSKRAAKFYNNFDFDSLKENDGIVDEYLYSLEVCDLKIYYTDDKSSVLFNKKYYDLGKNKKYLVSLLEEVVSDISNIYFYQLTPSLSKLEIEKKHFDILRKEINNLDYSEVNVDLAILRKYLLIVDQKKIYIDDLSGYAEYNGEIVKISDELISVLSNYLRVDNNECCSCCPDLKPGESCIALCCPCGG